MPTNEKKQATIKAKLMLIFGSILFAILLVFVAVLVTDYISGEKTRANNLNRSKQLEREQRISSCLDEAHNAYKRDWDAAADADGKLPTEDAKFYDDRYKDDKDDCYRLNAN